jgi:hypothetical protein
MASGWIPWRFRTLRRTRPSSHCRRPLPGQPHGHGPSNGELGGGRSTLLRAEHGEGGVSTTRCCGQSTAAAGPRLGGGGARSATDLMAEQRASDGFGGARRQRRGEVGGGEARSGGRARERVSERRNGSYDFLLKQCECLLPLDVNQRHPQPLRQRSRILHYGRRRENGTL